MQVKIGSDFPVDSSFPGDRASLHFEEKSGDTSNFPKTLHNFSTSSARWHQNIMPGNILTCWFYLRKFHSLFKPSAIFDHKRYFFDLLTIKTIIRCTPWLYRHDFVLITKTRMYNFDPLKPYFYIVKQGFTWVYIIHHILLVSTIYVWSRNMKKYQIFFLSENFPVFNIFE